jgi:hypothetical protein
MLWNFCVVLPFFLFKKELEFWGCHFNSKHTCKFLSKYNYSKNEEIYIITILKNVKNGKHITNFDNKMAIFGMLWNKTMLKENDIKLKILK